jgi:hypothetical protein
MAVVLTPLFQSTKPPRQTLITLPLEIQRQIFEHLLPSGKTFHLTACTTGEWFSAESTASSAIEAAHLRPSRFGDGFTVNHIGIRAPLRDIGQHQHRRHARIDLSLLLTCRHVYIQSFRILYQKNAFEYSTEPMHRPQTPPHTSFFDSVYRTANLHPQDFAIQMLRKLQAHSRCCLQVLYIDKIVPRRLNFGLSITYVMDERDFSHAKPAAYASKLSVAKRFSDSLEEFCRVVRELDLKKLGLGFQLEKMSDWNGRLEDVDFIQPLLELAGDPEVTAAILIWRDSSLCRFSERKNSGVFLKRLAAAM